MIHAIIKFSVKNKAFVFFLTSLLIIWGIFSFRNLPIDAVPDITNNQVQIGAVIPGWSAEEIERAVTIPIEAAMRGITNTTEIRSISRLGFSQVIVIFEDSVDIYRARQLVSERLSTIDGLPLDVKPQLGPISTGLGEIYHYAVDFKEIAEDPDERFKQLVELRSIQNWFIKPRLAGVQGIAEVNAIGGFERQIHIVPDPKKLAYYGISFVDIENAVSDSIRNIGGGYIEQDAEQFVVQAVGSLKNVNDVLNLPIKSLLNLQVISIKDVAKVIEGRESRHGDATYNGRQTVLGTVMMMSGENSRAVAERTDKRIKEIAQDLPDSMQIIPLYNRSDLVNATISTVWRNVISGAMLVIVVLFLLVGNMRAALITAITIPLALLVTIIGMRYSGIPGSLMSLGALDLGIIIDGVVIVVDHCMRKLKEHLKHKKHLSPAEIDDIIINAATEIRKAAGFGQLILIVVFLPIFALVGIEAKTFQPMASAFIFALAGAFVLSLTLAPVLIAFLLKKNPEQKDTRIMAFLESTYKKLLSSLLDKFSVIVTTAAILICLGVVLFLRLGAEFLPQLREGALAFHVIRPQNVSISMSTDLQIKTDKILLTHPEIRHVFSRIGTSEIATNLHGVNITDTYAILNDLGRGIDMEKFEETLLNRLNSDLPGMTPLISQPIQMSFNEILEGTRTDLTVKIFGHDLDKLEEIGGQIEELIKPISPASDVELERTSGFPMLTIEPNSAAMQRYGVRKSDVLELVSLAMSGEQVGYFFDQDRRFPIIIRLGEENRKDIDVIRNLPVPIFFDTTIPLSAITNINFRETYATINRDNGYRRAAVMVNIRGMDTQTFVRQAQKLVEDNIELPDGYFIEWGGQFKNLQEASRRLAFLAPLTLLIIFFMIFMTFGRFMPTALVLIGVPFALVGGVFSLQLTGLPFSISAAIGFIALMGISVLASIVLVGALGSSEYMELPLKERVVAASASRLRAVLMTAFTDMLGFLPMAVSTGIGAEVQRPLAVVVIGGIITSMILILIVLPTIYYKLTKKEDTETINPA
ncbi:MAG: CusA/CzcA family heavy metal efflux RND transporter [Leptospirales bacterium]|nr:CusA/CzcA family heavy metal efflux RND transporter [Leptospirales bacterium]